MILHETGYLSKENGTWKYFYYLKDHVGSNRLVLDDQGGVVQINNFYPYGLTQAEPTPRTDQAEQPYKFGGKELDRDFGVDAYDFEARMYNPAIGRFMQMDPLAEKYYSISPYAYCANNPLRYIDPTGMTWEDADGNKVEDHSKIKAYIFYDPKAFKSQSKTMYKELEKKYGKGSVAMSNVTTTAEFSQDWGDMAGKDVKEVNLNYHGRPQTINLDADTRQYITATGTGKTPKGNPAMNVTDLPTPDGNMRGAQLNINSCQSNNTAAVPKGSITIAQSFRDNTDFLSIRTTAQPVSYFNWFSPNAPHPQDHNVSWQFLYRPVPKKYPGVGLQPK